MISTPVGLEEVDDLLDELVFELTLWIGSIDLHDPLIEAFLLLVNDLIVTLCNLRDEVIDVSHHVREDEDAQKLDTHRE